MTQEDKQLLLKDLCARVLYGIKAIAEEIWKDRVIDIIDVSLHNKEIPTVEIKTNENHFINIPINLIKPYLRPMSSMTEEEEKEYEGTCPDYYRELETYDWLNAHHFDYRGLIEKGLALEAPEGMYKN